MEENFPIVCFPPNKELKRQGKIAYVVSSTKALNVDCKPESTITDVMKIIQKDTKVKVDNQLLVNYLSDSEWSSCMFSTTSGQVGGPDDCEGS
jgi:hypothetical protein